jgi:hypothetical protein
MFINRKDNDDSINDNTDQRKGFAWQHSGVLEDRFPSEDTE